MAFTSADLTQIEKAIATGTMTVELDGKKITYRSISDLVRARDLVKADIAAAAGASSATPSRSYAAYSRD